MRLKEAAEAAQADVQKPEAKKSHRRGAPRIPGQGSKLDKLIKSAPPWLSIIGDFHVTDSALQEKFVYATSRYSEDGWWKREENDKLIDVLHMLVDHQEGPKDGLGFMPVLASGDRRDQDTVEARNALTLDDDGSGITEEALQAALAEFPGLTVYYSTASHMLPFEAHSRDKMLTFDENADSDIEVARHYLAVKGGWPAERAAVAEFYGDNETGPDVLFRVAPKPRWRVIAIQAEPFAINVKGRRRADRQREFAALQLTVARRLGMSQDVTAHRLSQIMFLPRHRAGDTNFRAGIVAGPLLDVSTIDTTEALAELTATGWGVKSKKDAAGRLTATGLRSGSARAAVVAAVETPKAGAISDKAGNEFNKALWSWRDLRLAGFDIVAAVRKYGADDLERPATSDTDEKITVRCPYKELHTNADTSTADRDAGCFAAYGDSGAALRCSHHNCQSEGWSTVDGIGKWMLEDDLSIAAILDPDLNLLAETDDQRRAGDAATKRLLHAYMKIVFPDPPIVETEKVPLADVEAAIEALPKSPDAADLERVLDLFLRVDVESPTVRHDLRERLLKKSGRKPTPFNDSEKHVAGKIAALATAAKSAWFAALGEVKKQRATAIIQIAGEAGCALEDENGVPLAEEFKATIDDDLPGGLSGDLVPWMNKRAAVVRVGKDVVFTWEDKGNPESRYTFMKKEGMATWLAPITTSEGEPAFDTWCRSTARRQFHGVEFQPNLAKADPGKLNLFDAWALTPKEGDPATWGLWRQHLFENVCGGDVATYDSLLNWFAAPLKYPDQKVGYALVLIGEKGVGKDVVGGVLSEIIGKRYCPKFSRMSEVLGRFNARCRNAILMRIDEAYNTGEKADIARLNDLITEETFSIELKGVDVIDVASHARIIITSNWWNAAPVTEKERRYFVLEVGDAWRDDRAKFGAMLKQLRANNSAGLRAFMHHLLQRDLTLFMTASAPVTPALAKVMRAAWEPKDKWLAVALTDGKFWPSDHGIEIPWPDDSAIEFDKSALVESYEGFLGSKRTLRDRLTGDELFAHIRANIPSATMRKPHKGPRKCWLPGRATAAAEWEAAKGTLLAPEDATAGQLRDALGQTPTAGNDNSPKNDAKAA